MENRTNRYIENVKEIAKVAAKHDTDWVFAVDIYDHENGLKGSEGSSETTVLRKEFYRYVAGRKYDKDGNEVGEAAQG